MFGKEIGSLSENLVLNTAGKVKIRFGQKYIDLLNEKGELNVKFPKIIKTITSESEIKTNGFYYLNNALYAHIDNVTMPVVLEEQFAELQNTVKSLQERVEELENKLNK